MNKEVPILTIDGPAGSGKGTISQRVANTLGWNILDSGALYRLVALAAQKKGVIVEDDPDEAMLSRIALDLDVIFKPCVGGGIEIIMEGEDVTQSIRTEECGCAASQVATKNAVRSALLDRQRLFLESPGLVADGRDMGTVVFPNANVKVFLTASAEIRGQRRLEQLKERGISANLQGLIRDIEERDERDSNRKVAPLVPADGAIIINTGILSIDEVVAQVLDAVKKAY